MTSATDFQAVIGLEVHVQLNTASKLFCPCPITEYAPPNTAVCPICLGHPGTMPVANREAIRLGIMAALATSCTVHRTSIFSRKQYFYPDLSKGYQISQMDSPLATAGSLQITCSTGNKRIRVHRIHLEEDAAKSHHEDRQTLVDFNRGGTPLAEIVSEPDLRSAEEAEAYLRVLHRILVHTGITKGDLEKGHFRCDANVSVHRPGTPYGTRTELKNINSFKFVSKAITAEIARQIAVLNAGGRITQETRGLRGDHTVPLRSKEKAADYRHFPDPDLPPLTIDESLYAEALSALPATPMDTYLSAQDKHKESAFKARHQLNDYLVGVLLGHPELTAFFEACITAGGSSKPIANWVQGDVQRKLNEGGSLPSSGLTPTNLTALQRLLDDGTIARRAAVDLFDELWRDGGDPVSIVKERNLGKVDDEDVLRQNVQAAMAKNPALVQKYKDGNVRLIGFFIGEVMRATQGKADPALTRRCVVEELDSI